MSKYSKGFTYTKALLKLGYTQFSLTDINTMSTQKEFEHCLKFFDETGNEIKPISYPQLSDVVVKADEVALEYAWYEVRRLRDAYLRESDYVTAIANETGLGVPDEWKNYRQALRDITKQTDPSNLSWPEHPEGKRVGFFPGYEPPNSSN